jgi:(E)-4-hydroxy-3-methylbut-2-enyl-diphosphate synthase
MLYRRAYGAKGCCGLSKKNLKDPAVLNAAGYLYSPLLDKYNMAEQSVDFVYLGDEFAFVYFAGQLKTAL